MSAPQLACWAGRQAPVILNVLATSFVPTGISCANILLAGIFHANIFPIGVHPAGVLLLILVRESIKILNCFFFFQLASVSVTEGGCQRNLESVSISWSKKQSTKLKLFGVKCKKILAPSQIKNFIPFYVILMTWIYICSQRHLEVWWSCGYGPYLTLGWFY